MSTIAVTATPDLVNVPPRVKVDVTDSGAPAINTVNVVRTIGGVSTPVRTLDGNPLTLTTSGSNRVGTLYDYEIPYGQAVTYSTLEYPTGVSASTTLAVTVPWLVHPNIPARSMPITIESSPSHSRSVTRGVFAPMGRAHPIVFTDGRRKGAEGTLRILTQTDVERRALNLALDDAAVLLLNVPSSKAWGISTNYLSVGDVEVERPSRMLVQADRVWSLPYCVVDRPEGGSQAQWTLADLNATYASLNAIQAAYPTLNAVAFPLS